VSMDSVSRRDLLEVLSDLEHRQWAHWTRYMLDNYTPENVERWRLQVKTEYADLSEREKDSDRTWASTVLFHIDEYEREKERKKDG
jgi:hypothetical protein